MLRALPLLPLATAGLLRQQRQQRTRMPPWLPRPLALRTRRTLLEQEAGQPAAALWVTDTLANDLIAHIPKLAQTAASRAVLSAMLAQGLGVRDVG